MGAAISTAASEPPNPDLDAVRAAMGFAAPATTAELDTPDGQDGDGRTLRRTRNRERVIIALLDIVRSGELNPTVAGIADLAGVSHRSVFRYFDDLDDLVRTAIDHEVEHSMHLALIPDLGMGSLDRRVDSWVESRLRVHSATYQVGRVARHRAPGIPSIDIGLKGVYLLGRTRMRAHFANELDAMGADGGIMLDAAMVLTGFESYDVQHRVIQHSTERIRQIWLLALHELFTRTPEN